ncbi:MAG: ABC transporter, partial [Eubacterium sp.]|nr:ABC transporter [Eubacterium sp.]
LGKKHTVILSSHILSEISEVCDYIYIISRGCLVAAGSEKELVDQMAGKNVLEMEIKGNKDAVTAMMGTVSDVGKYEMTKSDKSDNVNLTIISDRENDVREKIFYACANSRLPILKMDFKHKTLEDIFIELTKDYAAPEKKKRRIGKSKAEKELQEDIDKEVEALNEISHKEENK